MAKDHKYIKREGAPGNYKYIYDVKNTFSGSGKGVAKLFNSGVKAANTYGKKTKKKEKRKEEKPVVKVDISGRAY